VDGDVQDESREQTLSRIFAHYVEEEPQPGAPPLFCGIVLDVAQRIFGLADAEALLERLLRGR
jgi:hypothetical protein